MDLFKIHHGQIIIVNLAEPNQTQQKAKLTVNVNDPFQGVLTCKNEKNIIGDIFYENVIEVLKEKRHHVILLFRIHYCVRILNIHRTVPYRTVFRYKKMSIREPCRY